MAVTRSAIALVLAAALRGIAPAAASIVLRGRGRSGCQSKEEPASCAITDITLRGDLGFPIQVEKTGDNSYEAIMCEETKSFKVQVQQPQAVFATGLECGVEGVSFAPTEVANGASETVTITATGTPRQGSETPSTSAEYTLTVQRLSVSADQTPCLVTRQRNALEDCGYAPILEAKRQEAAVSGGTVAAPPAVEMDR